MYKQTDKEVSIYAKVKNKETQQFREWNVMKKWGCLYTVLLFLVEQVSGKLFSPSQIKLLYNLLTCEKQLGKDMYVKNHLEVLKNGLRMLGYEKFHVEYRAKISHANQQESWGNKTGSNFLIQEVETELNNHHFQHEDFNPYEPEPKVKRLISERFYEIRILE